MTRITLLRRARTAGVVAAAGAGVATAGLVAAVVASANPSGGTASSNPASGNGATENDGNGYRYDEGGGDSATRSTDENPGVPSPAAPNTGYGGYGVPGGLGPAGGQLPQGGSHGS